MLLTQNLQQMILDSLRQNPPDRHNATGYLFKPT
jgi:hypothetical protein